MESSSGKVTAGPKLPRQRSRLQMHAPSSIQVAALPAAAVAQWNVAIPLLSPLDIVSLPSHHCDPTADDTPKDTRQPSDDSARKAAAEEASRAVKWTTWQQPAALFYHEPVAGTGPAFLLPHCA